MTYTPDYGTFPDTMREMCAAYEITESAQSPFVTTLECAMDAAYRQGRLDMIDELKPLTAEAPPF